jgi:hypothetical protein
MYAEIESDEGSWASESFLNFYFLVDISSGKENFSKKEFRDE